MHFIKGISRHIDAGVLDELTLTTNGSQLPRMAQELADNGVRRINISLDTLDADKFRKITRWGNLDRVLEGVKAARDAGLKVKINTVALKDLNEAEIPDIMCWAHDHGMDMTVIETMPMGEIDEDRTDRYLPLSKLRASLEEHYSLVDIPYKTAWPGPLCQRGRNGRPTGLHYTVDPQFLRELQSGAPYMHRNALHVPRSERCGGFARTASGVSRQLAFVGRH